MNRNDLQRLAGTRIREAKTLFRAAEYSGAYYLAGYAIECALKACIAKGVKRYDFPEKGLADKVFTHDLPTLLKHSRLNVELEATCKANPDFATCWDAVIKWSETSRYTVWTRNQAEELLDAILRRKDGVMPWIKQRW
ncbi:MAG TPA: DNA-binding protein [Acidobacteriaceae bacterium]